MPFRLLVLTRAKHLTQLGLIWWGHGMTPWPALSVFSKWNQLSHRVGERWREAERISALMLAWASRAHQSGAACSLLGGHFIGLRPSLGRYAAPQLSSQAEHPVKTHSVDLETITNGPDALAYYHSTFHFEDVCKRGLHPCTFSHRCVCMCVCGCGQPLWRHFILCMFQNTCKKNIFLWSLL